MSVCCLSVEIWYFTWMIAFIIQGFWEAMATLPSLKALHIAVGPKGWIGNSPGMDTVCAFPYQAYYESYEPSNPMNSIVFPHPVGPHTMFLPSQNRISPLIRRRNSGIPVSGFSWDPSSWTLQENSTSRRIMETSLESISLSSEIKEGKVRRRIRRSRMCLLMRSIDTRAVR